MTKQTYTKIFTIFSIFSATCFLGCSSSTDVKVDNSNGSNRSANVANIGNSAANTTNIAPTNANISANNSTTNSANTTPKTNQPVAKIPTPSIGKGGDDFSLFMNVRNAISVDKELVSGIIIDVKDGNVTLNGKVATEAQKKKAEELLTNVKGIKSIKNNLRTS